jgi:hypothetical protein
MLLPFAILFIVGAGAECPTFFYRLRVGEAGISVKCWPTSLDLSEVRMGIALDGFLRIGDPLVIWLVTARHCSNISDHRRQEEVIGGLRTDSVRNLQIVVPRYILVCINYEIIVVAANCVGHNMRSHILPRNSARPGLPRLVL